MKVFEHSYAQCYDALYSSKNYSKETNYILSLLKKHQKLATKDILNFGCGTGSHDIELAKKGFNIFGIDQSASMLKIAKEKFKQNGKHGNFKKGNIQKVNLNKKFDSVICMFAVMGYQTTNEDVINTMKNASKHLKKNGLFIFDCWYGPAVILDPPKVAKKRIVTKTLDITRDARSLIDLNESTVEVNYKLKAIDLKNKTKNTFKEKHLMRFFFKKEIEHFLSISNMKMIKTYRWLHLTFPSQTDWNFCIVAQKN